MKNKQKIINEINKLHNKYENCCANFENACYSPESKEDVEKEYFSYLKQNLTEEFIGSLTIEEFFELPLTSITNIIPISSFANYSCKQTKTHSIALNDIFEVYVNENTTNKKQTKAKKTTPNSNLIKQEATPETNYNKFIKLLELNNISISAVQRIFSYGFLKASKVIDELISCGAIEKVNNKYKLVNKKKYLQYAKKYPQ